MPGTPKFNAHIDLQCKFTLLRRIIELAVPGLTKDRPTDSSDPDPTAGAQQVWKMQLRVGLLLIPLPTTVVPAARARVQNLISLA